MRKVLCQNPGTIWTDWIPDVCWALRVLVSRSHGYTPYRLVFKTEPLFPDNMAYYEADPSLPMDIEARTEEEMLAELEEIWQDTITVARRRLAAGDKQMKREYMERH